MPNRLFLLLFCFIINTNTYAQMSNKEIESSVERLNKAMITPDKSALDMLTAEELSYGHSTGVVQNKSEFIKDILSGPVKFSRIDNADQRTTATDNTATVRNICSIKGTRDGAPLDLKIGILMIWVKKGDGWKLLARQGYKLP
ncbi:MAG TPA: nuclear transport factor 2 family protein [Puia sp.]